MRRGRAARPRRRPCSAATGRRRSERPRRRASRAGGARRCSSPGVSPPLCEACTTIVPCHARVRRADVREGAGVVEGVRAALPGREDPGVEAAVGRGGRVGVGPLFVQVTVSPWLMVIWPGENWKSAIVTEPLAAALALGLRLGSRGGSSDGAGAGAASGAAAGCSGAGAVGSGVGAGCSGAGAGSGSGGAGGVSPSGAVSAAGVSPAAGSALLGGEQRAWKYERRDQGVDGGKQGQVLHRRRTLLGLRPGARARSRLGTSSQSAVPVAVLAAADELDLHAADRPVIQLQDQLAAAARPLPLGLPKEHVGPAATLDEPARA